MATGVPFWRHFCIDSVADIAVEKRNRFVVEKVEMLQLWKKNLQLLNFEYDF